MNLTSPSQVKAWCIEHDFHPNKTLGQNFLVDANILKAIVDIGLEGVPAGSEILEIGPGLGVLTEELLRRSCAVKAIEKDAALAESLGERLAGVCTGAARLEVVKGDALDVLARGGAPGGLPRYMISNLPYQAGTRILLDLAAMRHLESMTVLLQTEVAERLAAKEGGRARSLAGVWVQLDYDVEIVRKVPASCFWPRPEVGSAVARLRRHRRNEALSERERDLVRRFAKRAFSQRRKMLSSVFRSASEGVFNLKSVTIPERLRQARAEALSIDDWVEFAKGALANENS